MPVDLPPKATVVRFRPSAAEAVLHRAEQEHRRKADPERPEATYYRVSCFADVKRSDEDADALLRRLIAAAQLDGLDVGNNKNCWVTEVKRLQDHNVTFWKEGYDGEPEEHYLMDLGTSPTLESVEKILEVFQGPERIRL